MAFNEDLYLAETPAAREAIANGLYKTGLEYYLAVGRFQSGQEGFFEGTSGNDVVVGVSGAENHIGGVATNVEGEYVVDPDAPFGISGTITLTPQSLGVGEVDLLVGTAGTLDEFFLSVELKLDIGTDSGEAVPVYVGMGDRDYGIIRNFSAADGDIIVLAGKPKDYLYESVNGNVEISTLDGDLVGVVEGVSSLSVLEDLSSYNQTLLMSGDKSIPNVFDVVPSGFDEEFYLGIFPDVGELVETGVFESGLDHYQSYGQYVPTENKYQDFATGTNGNDILIGFGTYEVDYFPVAMSYVEEVGDYTFESLGVGEVDTIVAVPNIINEFILSSFPTFAYDTAEQFYVGNGDADYARIQNLKDAGKGELYFAGKREDYLFEDKEGDVYVSYKGDLVSIIEELAVSDLQITDTYIYEGFEFVDAIYEPVPFEAEFQPSPVNPYDGSIYLRNFDEDVYLAAFPAVAQDIADGKYESALDHYLKVGQFQGSDVEGTFTGSSDSDIVLSFGANKLLWGIGATATVDANNLDRFNLINDSLGKGELDVLVGSDGINEFQLTAYNYVDFGGGSADSLPLYIGGGNTDYALMRNFKDGDSVILSGNPADYKYGVNNGNYEIYTLSGDLVGIVEGVDELQVGGVFDTFEVFELVSGSAAGGFDEDYYVKQFDLQKLIADGVIESGADHYQAIGQYGFANDIKYQELITGTDGNDTLIGYGKFEVDFWGVGIEYISKDVTVDFGTILPPEITDKRLRRYESFGEGEIDTMISVPGIINEYILGSSTNILYSEAQPFYIGQGDNDYALIKNLKTTSVGELVFSGDFAKYTFEDKDTGLHAYYEGDLVAIFEDLTFSELGEREDYPTRGIFVYEYAPKGTANFNESLYLTFNPDIAALVEQGIYKSGLDHYIQVGQFGNNEGFFTGTDGNDAITGFGEDLDLAGVGITAAFDGEKYILTPSSLGVGEIDTLLGTENDDGFYLGIPTVIDDVNGNTTQALYIGEGTGDYGLIKNFSEGDYISLAGTPDDYIYKSEGGDFKIYSASGDLVGIVKDVVELQVSSYTEGSEGFELGITEAGFDGGGWVSLYPEVQEQIDAGFFDSPLDQYVNVGQYEEGGWVFEGTTGNDTLISWTQNAEVRLAGVILESGFEPAGFEDGQYYFGVNPTSFGVGEIDVLVHSADTGTVSESLLGWFRGADGSIQRFYVGQGDADYALVKNFDKNDLDEIFLAGSIEDYTYTDVDGNLHIAYQGDLVGIVEGLKFEELEPADEGEGSGAFALIGIPDDTNPELPFGRVFQIELDNLLTITDFDNTQDAIALEGSFSDYRFEGLSPYRSIEEGEIAAEQDSTAEKQVKIFTKDGVLVATIAGVEFLTTFPLVAENKTYLVAGNNSLLPDAIEPTFYEPFYPLQNPDVVPLVESGEYSSYFDHLIEVGQFEEREDTFFVGTEGNDTVVGWGYESIVLGVPISEAQYVEGQDVVPVTTGVGERDILIGTPGIEIFLLGNSNLLNPEIKTWYVGEGDTDYALIKDFDPIGDSRTGSGDRVRIAGDWRDYTQEVVDGNTRISKDGDLVAIVENIPELIPYFAYKGQTDLRSIEDLLVVDPNDPFSPSNTFLESVYLENNPDAAAAVEAGEYASGFDHFLKVGLFQERQAVYQNQGTALGNSLLFGVPVTDIELDSLDFTTSSTGTGEVHFLQGSPFANTFVLGDNAVSGDSPQMFYIGNGDEDYAEIYPFDVEQDRILVAGVYEDYQFEKVDSRFGASFGKDLKIFTKEGDLVAIVIGVAEDLDLKPFAGENPEGGFYLVSSENNSQNEFYDTYIKPFFYEPLYPIVNPDVDALIEQGLYESYYDHLIKAGQFEDREDTLFAGTSGDDVMSGIGAESILVGVAIDDATYPPPDVKPLSTGVGEIDTLLGSSGENIFALGNGLLINDTAEAFYIGEGDNDYALIKNFDETLDFITMAGLASDYTFTAVDGNVRIAKDGDLIAIVEGDINLVAYPPSVEAGGFYVSGAANHELAEFNKAYFNEEFFLEQNPEAQESIDNGEYDSAFDYHLNNGGKLTATEGQQFTLWHGTGERDFVGAFGGDAGLIGVKVSDFEVEDGLPIAFTTETNGTGEQDFLYGAPGKNIFYLGTLGENAESFYVGNGDEDYATIINFDPKQDYIALANDRADETIVFFSIYDKYTFTEVDGNTEIATKDGDLVAIVEGATGLKPFTGYTPAGATYLVSTENEFFDTYIKPTFFEPWYLELDAADYDNSVQKAIDAGLVTDAYDHYLKIGQFEAREDSVFAGGEGDDTIYGTGAEPVLIGVEITEAVYARDNKPVTTGVGDVDTLIGAPGGDTFVLGNGAVINDAPQAYYVGEGDADYALIKGLSGNSVTIPNPEEDDATIDCLFLAGRVYDYIFAKDGDDLRISTRDGDLIAIVEDAPIMETPFSVPGATYIYGIDNVKTFDNLWGASGGFYEPFYLAENPEVAELIANGEYESAVEHYFKVGQFKEDSEAIFHDPNNEGFTVGYGAADLLFGVSLTSVDGEKEGWTSVSTGVGEQDFFIGGAGVTTYVIGNDNILEPSKASDVYYVGEGDDDYAFIQSFDPYKDFIFAAGEFSDYTIEMVDDIQDVFGRIVPIKNLEISYKGDLVAVLNNIGGSLTLPDGFTLQEFAFGEERPNAFAFVAAQNEFLPPDPATFFNESIYLTLHPKVQQLIDNGEYESAYDYYLEVGEDKGHRAFLSGTAEGNDDITAIGDASTLFGVEVTGFDKENNQFIIEDDGTGEIDSLTGNEGRNRFVLGNDGQSFYVGGTDEDYANIYNFDRLMDSLVIAGDITDYNLETVTADGGNNLEISTETGDLVAIFHDIDDLTLAQLPETAPRFPNDSILVASDRLSSEPLTSLFGDDGENTIDLEGSNQLVFADAGNDLIDTNAATGNNFIYGGDGDDTFILGSKDVLTGQDGDDRFFVQTGGDNRLTGGMGADQFWLANAEIPTSANTVTDFTVGEDVIGIAGIGTSFETLTLTQEGMNALVGFDGNDLAILKGIQVTDLNGDSFVFV
jgi:Ca2+-binding RTX toxin-like protein